MNNARPITSRFPWTVMVLAVALLASALLAPADPPPAPLTWYAQSGLKNLEWDNYLSWLNFNGESALAKQLRQQYPHDPHAFAAALFDPVFVAESRQQGRRFWSPQAFQEWQALRSAVPEQRARSPLYQWGLLPQAASPGRFFSAPLVILSPWLVLTAVILLAPLVLDLERRLGSGRTLVLGLVGCLASGGAYLIAARPGLIPLHGPAPVLLAWAGAWLGLWPTRLALPFWHPGKRRCQTLALPPAWSLVPTLMVLAGLAVLSDVTLAWAGLGALLSGAALVQIMRPAPPLSEASTGSAADPEQQQALAQAWRALANLEADTASALFAHVLAQAPRHFDALTGQFVALQLQGDHAAWLANAHRLFRHPAGETGQSRQIAQHWQQYRQRTATLPTAETGWPLVATLARAHFLQDAEQLARELTDGEGRSAALATLIETLETEGLGHRAHSWINADKSG